MERVVDCIEIKKLFTRFLSRIYCNIAATRVESAIDYC